MKIGIVSTWPPEKCGIAEFSSDVCKALQHQGAIVVPIYCVDSAANAVNGEYQLISRDLASYTHCAHCLNSSDIDIICIQHEFGIFGGDWGEYILHFSSELQKPIVTIFHTVITKKNAFNRILSDVVVRLSSHSSAVVVMSHKAYDILVNDHTIAPDKIHVIPHGVPYALTYDKIEARKQLQLPDRVIVSTFGLMHPNKGLEYSILALKQCLRRGDDLMFYIIGEQHPDLIGKYLNFVETLVEELDLNRNVFFVNRYVSRKELEMYFAATDIYVNSYPHKEQASSGTLAHAIGYGKAIICSAFWHAEELLKEGNGLLVDPCDIKSLSAVLSLLARNPALRSQLETTVTVSATRYRWDIIGRDFYNLFCSLQ